MAFDSEKIQRTTEALERVVKHFGVKDTRRPSLFHNANPRTQKPHGNRPGIRTQETILSALDVLPNGFGDAPGRAQADYFVQAAGYSSPVVQVGDEFWLAPPHVKMLPERGAGENLTVGEASLPPNTNIGEGLSSEDELELPAAPDSEEGKRFLEAAAEHRKNNYQGPTTPRLEAMFGEMLRSKHPRRAPKASSSGLSPSDQHRALKAVVAERRRRKWAPLQKAQAIAAIGNVLQNFSPRNAAHMQFVDDLLDLLDMRVSPPGSRTSTAAETTPQASRNARLQEERAEEQRQSREQRAEERRERQEQRQGRRQRARRLGQRLE